MAYEISGAGVPEAFFNGLQILKSGGVEENSRNGPVRSLPGITVLTIRNPMERVLFDPVRNANPFFHLMESIWMLSGSNDVRWIEYFNKRMREYADPGTDTHHGAYGHRWRRHFGVDQIYGIIDLLKEDPTTRRAVMSMWDPRSDLAPHNDLPCNTQIMFRVTPDFRLDMTVVNRSNDFVWGMLGANAVHMTMLHELIARATCIPIGYYRVMSNNVHVYTGMPNFTDIINTAGPYSHYDVVERGTVTPMPILMPEERWGDFLTDAKNFVLAKGSVSLKTWWFNHVALPVELVYRQRKEGAGTGEGLLKLVKATDWRLACQQWIDRKRSVTEAR